ncbi:MAG: ribose transport system substrate-binding protein [Clostridium sp.]|jgi:ribose transport system substrate-binding protein
MGKMSKRLGMLVMATMIVSILGGCGKAAAPAADTAAAPAEKTVKIAVVLKAINSDYWKQVKAGADDAGKTLGVEVQVVGPNAETDIAGQTSMMEDQIVKGVSALVVAPSQPSAALTTFDKADAAGIPVILIDTDAEWDKKKAFVGTGNEAGGKVGGDFIAKSLKAGDDIVMLRGALGDATHDQRIKGATDALTAAGFKVSAVQPADSDRNKGMSVMENLLQTHPNVKAVFCSNDEMALGAARALKAANKKDVVVVGFDGSPDALTSILAGELTASVAQSAYNIGKLGVEAGVKLAKGETIEARIDTGTNLITKENAQKAKDDLAKMLAQ